MLFSEETPDISSCTYRGYFSGPSGDDKAGMESGKK
jgi:hypothetical protein